MHLGKMKRINDLRAVWQHEARNFSKWLALEENLQQLSEAIGVDIVIEELEASVGSFNVDLYAVEDGTERKIIIENQLEDTNHDHLGKLITYASGKGAEIIIWIVKHARDEHRQAIEWLNQNTGVGISIGLQTPVAALRQTAFGRFEGDASIVLQRTLGLQRRTAHVGIIEVVERWHAETALAKGA